MCATLPIRSRSAIANDEIESGAFLEWLEGKTLPGVEVLRVNPPSGITGLARFELPIDRRPSVPDRTILLVIRLIRFAHHRAPGSASTGEGALGFLCSVSSSNVAPVAPRSAGLPVYDCQR